MPLARGRRSSIDSWLDQVITSASIDGPLTADTSSSLKRCCPVHFDQADDDANTPRAKRPRSLRNVPHLSACSPITSDTTATSESGLKSHASGRRSPVKQLQVLAYRHNVVCCNFDDVEDDVGGAETCDVMAMRSAMQRYADGVGILGHPERDDFLRECLSLPKMDQERLGYLWASEPGRRHYGTMPALRKIRNIVSKARVMDRAGVASSEDEWNTEVHLRLLKVAHKTSVHKGRLGLNNVKSSKIEPRRLLEESLPGRVIDYVITLDPDPKIKDAWASLKPLSGAVLESWNHISKLCQEPIAINIETKAPSKSWTDGKPQIAVWIKALLERLRLLRTEQLGKQDLPDPPALPVLIAQGHDWHLLIVKKVGEKLVVRDEVGIGTTRTVFDTFKVLAALHWLMDWAEIVWRAYFVSLLA